MKVFGTIWNRMPKWMKGLVILLVLSVPIATNTDESNPSSAPPAQEDVRSGIQAGAKTEEGRTAETKDEVAANSSQEIQKVLRQTAVEKWGDLEPKEARFSYFEHVNDILIELLTANGSVLVSTEQYLKGEISKEKVLSVTDEVSFIQAKTLAEAGWLTALAPDDKKLADLHQSLLEVEARIGNVAIFTGQVIKSGERSASIGMEIKGFQEDLSETIALIEDMLRDLQVANPTRTNAIRKALDPTLLAAKGLLITQ